MITSNLSNYLEKAGVEITELLSEFQNAYNKQPEVCNDGGNDKRFFTFKLRGQMLFAAQNETGGITLMLPEDY